MENHELTKRRDLKKLVICCLFRTIKKPTEGTKSMLFKNKTPRQAKFLSSEKLEKEFMLAVKEIIEFVSQDESELIAPIARFGLSKY